MRRTINHQIAWIFDIQPVHSKTARCRTDIPASQPENVVCVRKQCRSAFRAVQQHLFVVIEYDGIKRGAVIEPHADRMIWHGRTISVPAHGLVPEADVGSGIDIGNAELRLVGNWSGAGFERHLSHTPSILGSPVGHLSPYQIGGMRQQEAARIRLDVHCLVGPGERIGGQG